MSICKALVTTASITRTANALLHRTWWDRGFPRPSLPLSLSPSLPPSTIIARLFLISKIDNFESRSVTSNQFDDHHSFLYRLLPSACLHGSSVHIRYLSIFSI